MAYRTDNDLERLPEPSERTTLSLPPAKIASPQTSKQKSTLLRNSGANIVRIGLTTVVGILLPSYLTHHMPVQTYGAWVLVLQLGAYVGYLNLGVQTALAKFIAEYDARQDLAGCGRCASVGLQIMLCASVLGVLLSGLLAYEVPRLFREMPLSLLHDVRLSICFVGASLAIGLSSSVFSAIFLGLQRYKIPTLISVITRFAYGAVIYAAVFLHASLINMALAASAVNLLTSAMEFYAWRTMAAQVRIHVLTVERQMLRQMLHYCSVLTVWSACMLLITGLDVTIVGHYSFREVAFYSIANAPTTLILTLIGALLGPLLPATSAYSVHATPQQMGGLLLKTTRYSSLFLFATGIPVMVGGYLLLRLWVGSEYATRSILFLHVLLLANVIRNFGAPYSTMVVATSRQRFGTISALTEACVNLFFSIVLAQRIGALGVALGTLIGAFAGLGLHFGLTMHYTIPDFAISRTRLFLGGLLRPAVMTLPSLLLLPLWWRNAPPALGPLLWLIWFSTTAALTWLIAMTPDDRTQLIALLRRRLHPPELTPSETL